MVTSSTARRIFECNGSTFNRDHFPKLAAAYPHGFLPDLRGDFILG
ncbi:hypothetical protein B6D12_05170 [Gilliamella apicola]|nr:hypothetical protein B5S41_08320 [Gilliamella apicola]OTP94567.1 hypothetical protein B6D13_06750 [Gilliamella apicola]OTP94998.1 hypothetical protein B6D05_06910 [Gilliamella apicola]OTQ00058.1 hypothetical protein B6D07_10895 [Gilliamella apicola]OTQ06028.1 hypothetical protein B6D12_05170 [Gilliamella apicola]